MFGFGQAKVDGFFCRTQKIGTVRFHGLYTEDEDGFKRLENLIQGATRIIFDQVKFNRRQMQEPAVFNILNTLNLKCLEINKTCFLQPLTTFTKINSLETFIFCYAESKMNANFRTHTQSMLYESLCPFISTLRSLTKLKLAGVALEKQLLNSISRSIEILILKDCYIGDQGVLEHILLFSKLKELHFLSCRASTSLDLQVFEQQLHELPYFSMFSEQ